ncbi:glycosyltransferase [Companilactobacillus farciminis]|uniref:glycosyltransferase n=1 Tax=Companilactobacillus farciminis TaxID=1612 RepID=UPI00232BD642|nr:glycosyltransferase [Companilactobacillus farciminis]WCG35996.1 glycosyltransferase [Companilactobacillus farciminis]
MKKIVHVVESFGSGVYSYLLDLTSGLCDEYDVYILYGLREETPVGFRNQFDSRINFIKINDFTRELNLVKDIKAGIEIKRIIEDIDPDIIHLHSSKAGGVGRMIKYSKKRKVFYTPHGYAFLNINNSRIKSKLFFVIEKLLGYRNIVTVACSKGEYLESLKVTKKSTFINNSIDAEYLSKFRSKKTNEEKVVFTIGRISNQKNPELFNNIAKKMDNYKFVWIGDGPLKSKLTSKNIVVTGWLPREKVLKIIQPFKFFIMTSKWEGLPISLLEAMYFSKNCFVTNVTGNKDVIEDGVNGYIFEDVDDFCLKMENSRDLGNIAKKCIKEKYTKKQMINKYLRLYND